MTCSLDAFTTFCICKTHKTLILLFTLTCLYCVAVPVYLFYFSCKGYFMLCDVGLSQMKVESSTDQNITRITQNTQVSCINLLNQLLARKLMNLFPKMLNCNFTAALPHWSFLWECQCSCGPSPCGSSGPPPLTDCTGSSSGPAGKQSKDTKSRLLSI